MPQLSLARNFLGTIRAQIVNRDRFGRQTAASRALSLFLIVTLLAPLPILAPVEKTRAAGTTPPRHSLGIGSKPAFASSLTGGLLDASVIAGLILPNLPSMLTRQEAPDPFPVPREPTFGNRLFANALSLLSFVAPNKTEAENAMPMDPELDPGPMPVTAVGAVKFDFDGDGKTDMGRFNAATNPQFRVKGSGGNFIDFPLGSSTSVIAPGDYDGDGVTDPAVANGGTWTYIGSSDQTSHTITLGETGIPMVGDYNGDGTTDAAVFDPSSGDWHVRFTGSSTTELPHHFGQAGDIPVSGDFDRDGTTDFAVFRPGDGNWYCDKFDQGYVHWGQAGDIPLQGDFDADQISDLVIYRPSTGTWYVATSSTGYNDHLLPQVWGNYADQPVPGDYNGDGVTDHAVWRPSSGDWHILESIYWGGEGKPAYVTHNLGASGDVAVPSAYTKQIGGTVTGYDMAGVRLDPSNATGETNLYSQNFSWGTSLVSLPGRSGLDAGFGISYNSLVWAKVGSAMVFDPDNSNVSPGFRFGFPVIEPVYYDSGKGRWAYMMVTPDGARVEFRQMGASGTFETVDSSYTRLVASVPSDPLAPINGPVEDIIIAVTTTDGTQVRYDWKGGAFRCNQIKDRNGNYITVTHNTNGLLTKVTDTLGREINVSYDTDNSPTAITQTWNTGTHTWATFSYATKEVTTNFGNLTVFGPPNTAVLKVLDKITFADGSNTRFLYNSYAQVSRVENYAPDNHELNHVVTNLGSIPVGAQSDCPRATDTYSWVEGFHGLNGVPSWTSIRTAQTTETTYNSPDGSGTIPVKAIKVWMEGHPDYLYSKIYFGGSGWNKGLQIATEDCLGTDDGCSNKQRWTWTKWTQDRVSETYAPYPINPRVIETRTGDNTNVKRSTISYYKEPFSGGELGFEPDIAMFGLVHEVRLFDAVLNLEWKKSVTTYDLSPVYVARRIIGLPISVEVYGRDTGGSTLPLVSKMTYEYDGGNLTGTDPVQDISPVQHDNTNYGSSFNTGRGNLTSTTRWDVTNQTSEVTSSIRYNTAGSPVAQIDPMGRITRIGYADNFNSTVGVSTYAYPTVITDAAGSELGDSDHSSFVTYRYDIGANVEATSPASNGSSYGKKTKRTYDNKGRLERNALWEYGASGWREYSYTRMDYAGYDGVHARVLATVVDSNQNGVGDAADEVLTESWSDGAGRVRATRTENPGSDGGYSGKLFEYDILGRLRRESVPTEINSSWDPSGPDDGVRGWVWNSKEYDWMGRVTKAIPSDSNGLDGKDTVISYNGCGCAGGQITTIKGPKVDAYGVSGSLQLSKRRTQKVYEDILGRTWKTEILDLDGNNPSAPYSTTKTYFNGRDQATVIRQYEGSQFSSTYQDTTIEFDGHGRPWRTHKPDWRDRLNNYAAAYTTTTYNIDDTVASITDPRGAVATYTYGGPYSDEKRPLVTNIAYGAPSPNPTPNPNPPEGQASFYIPDAPSVAFEYDNAGNRKKMTDVTGTLNYQYDSLSRLVEERKFFNDTFESGLSNGYALNYEYFLNGGINKITGPFGHVTTYSSDALGRVTDIGTGSDVGEVGAYAKNINYRSFGGVKGMTLNTSAAPTSVNLTYDNALRPLTYEADNSTTGTDKYVQKANYTYYNDGMVKEVDNLRDGSLIDTFDQKNEYDFAGRLTKNTVGPSGSTFKQTLGYDAYNNLTSRTTKTYGLGEINSNGPSGPVDSAGNVVASSSREQEVPIPGSPSWYNDNKRWYYDAAGRMARWEEDGPWGDLDMRGGEFTFDGDGRPVKNAELHRQKSGVSWGNWTAPYPWYYMYSSVTGQKIADIYFDGTNAGQRVYMGGAVIYDDTFKGPYLTAQDSYYSIGFKVTDPVTGSTQEIGYNGSVPPATDKNARNELAGLGTSIPTVAPAPNTPYPPNYYRGGFAGDANTGCMVDWMPTSCSEAFGYLGAGVGVVYNGPQFQRVVYNGIETWGQYRAYGDGYAGYVPGNARYRGYGLVEPVGPSVKGKLRRNDTDLSKLNGADNENDLRLIGDDLDLIYGTPPCDVASYEELTSDQRSLIGSVDDYNALNQLQKAVFVNVTSKLLNAGADITNVQLGSGGVTNDRLLFASGSTAGLQASIRARGDTFEPEAIRIGHSGMNDFSVRERVLRNSLQVGFGDAGAYADIDLWNPLHGKLFVGEGYRKHQREVRYNRRNKVKTPHFYIANLLGNCK